MTFSATSICKQKYKLEEFFSEVDKVEPEVPS